MPSLILGLLVAAGIAIVVQNQLMVRMTGMVSTVLIPLLMNSAVGFIVLLTLLLTRNGVSGLQEAIGTFRLWSLFPGLLGSFFVAASILGYQRLGAAATISVLIASQLVVGLAVDIATSNSATIQNCLPAVIGAILLVSGALLVASRTF